MKHIPLLLLMFCVSLPGCSKYRVPDNTGRSETEATPLAGTPTPVETKDNISEERAELKARVSQLLTANRYAELESLAQSLRSSKARFGDGGWKIHRFYPALERPNEDSPQSEWEAQEKLYKDWVATYPNSVTSHTALATFLVDYAWNARGSGWGNQVTQTGYDLFKARLQEALNVLDDAAIARSKCPEWYRVRMFIALGQNWNRIEYDKLFAEAKAYEPGFFGYDTAKAQRLLPRWGGQPGEWEKVAELDAEKLVGLGVEGYARVVEFNRHYYKNIFKESKASWPKTRQGFEILRRKYPDSLELLNSFACLACLAGDGDVAKPLMKEINGRMVLQPWCSENYFIQCQNWAFSSGI